MDDIRNHIGLAPPPGDIFEFPQRTGETELQRSVKGQGGFYFPDHAEYIPGEGCFEYFKGYDGHPAPLFPMSRVPFWDTIHLLNPLKRDVITILRIIVARPMRMFLLLFALAGKKRRGQIFNVLVDAFNEKAMGLILFKYLKDEYYSKPVKEIIGFCERFMVLLGVERDKAYRAARTIGMMFENDQAYCWRFQDVMTEATERLKKEPYDEVKKLVEILISREPSPEGMAIKYHAILKTLRYALLIPSIRNALKKSLEPLDLKNCSLTENDIYHTLLYSGYNFQGKSQEERLKIYEGYHGEDQSKWPARWSLQ